MNFWFVQIPKNRSGMADENETRLLEGSSIIMEKVKLPTSVSAALKAQGVSVDSVLFASATEIGRAHV